MGIIRKRVFITVKTYPNPSASYVETVCTAGIVENEGWIRLYPVPYRVSSGLADKQLKKYQWIDVDVVKRRLLLRINVPRVIHRKREV